MSKVVDAAFRLHITRICCRVTCALITINFIQGAVVVFCLSTHRICSRFSAITFFCRDNRTSVCTDGVYILFLINEGSSSNMLFWSDTSSALWISESMISFTKTKGSWCLTTPIGKSWSWSGVSSDQFFFWYYKVRIENRTRMTADCNKDKLDVELISTVNWFSDNLGFLSINLIKVIAFRPVSTQSLFGRTYEELVIQRSYKNMTISFNIGICIDNFGIE